MVNIGNPTLFLTISILSMLLISAYKLYKGPNWGYFFGGILTYLAVLPLIITNVFNFSTNTEQFLFGAGIVSAFLGVVIIHRTKYSSKGHRPV